MNVTNIRGQSFVAMPHEEMRNMLRALLAQIPIDESWYLERYPDVATAIKSGKTKSAREHFVNSGYFEGRWPSPVAVDEEWYLATYPEVGRAVREGVVESAQRHFEQNGYKEGRRPWPRERD
ncbi:MAG: hypothetical protein AB7O80_17110 [Acetobacteraceae bacterium]